jgi:hypothetical protein
MDMLDSTVVVCTEIVALISRKIVGLEYVFFLCCWYRKCALFKTINAEVQVVQFNIERKFDGVS